MNEDNKAGNLSEWWKRTSEEMAKTPEYKRWAKWMAIRLWIWDFIEKPIYRFCRRRREHL